MAGLSGHQAVVDVVAASERLRPSAPPAEQANPQASAETGSTPAATAGERGANSVPSAASSLALDPGEEQARCALGHPAPQGFRFCPTCGVPMDAPPAALAPPAARPRPASELTAAELAERERQHLAAVAAAAQFEREQPPYVPTEGEAVLIHFIADGLTAFGQVWYRGQELEIGPDHPRWPEARQWITLTRWQQIERWSEQKFDFGPWPGRPSYADAQGSFEQLTATDLQGNPVQLTGPSQAELTAADEAERRRARAVPAPVFT
jgi:hypothetical protein